MTCSSDFQDDFRVDMECKCNALNEAETCQCGDPAQLEQYQMQQDENQKIGVALVSRAEDLAIMSRSHDSLRHQRADAGQRMSEDSDARDNLQQKTMELTEELHEAETACVCQTRTSRWDGTLVQRAWQPTPPVNTLWDHIARQGIPDGTSQRDESGRGVSPDIWKTGKSHL